MQLDSFKSVVEKYDVIFFDAFGVLKTHDSLIPGIEKTFAYLREQQKDFYILTNDASRSPIELAASYHRLGLYDIVPECIISSGMLAREYLALKVPEGTVAYLGTEKSAHYLETLGLTTIPISELTLDAVDEINAVGGYTMQRIRSEELRLGGQNIIRNGEDFWYLEPSYIIDESNNINMLTSIYNGVDASQYYSMISYLFRANYTFDSRYIATVTFRRDGSSKFSKENRYANFPSFALGWNIINESFMSEADFLSNLKVRASWGKIGNDKIDYSNRFSLVRSDLFAIFGNPDMPFPAATYSKSGNPDLIWDGSRIP